MELKDLLNKRVRFNTFIKEKLVSTGVGKLTNRDELMAVVGTKTAYLFHPSEATIVEGNPPQINIDLNSQTSKERSEAYGRVLVFEALRYSTVVINVFIAGTKRFSGRGELISTGKGLKTEFSVDLRGCTDFFSFYAHEAELVSDHEINLYLEVRNVPV